MRFFPLPWISQFCEDVVVVLLPLLGQAAGRIVHGCCHPPLRRSRLAQLLLGSLAGYNCLCGAVDRSLRCPPSVSPPARLDIFNFSPQRTFTFFYNFFAEMLTFSPKIVIFSINPDISSTNMRSALLLFRTLLANNAPARLS